MYQTTAKTIRKRRSKLPLEVDLTDYVGALVAAEFECFRKQNEEMKIIMDQQSAFLQQVVANTQYPLKPYTEEDFTAMFGLAKRTQQNYRKAGKLKYMKLGEKVLYTHEHIQEFIQLHEVNTTKSSD